MDKIDAIVKDINSSSNKRSSRYGQIVYSINSLEIEFLSHKDIVDMMRDDGITKIIRWKYRSKGSQQVLFLCLEEKGDRRNLKERKQNN